MNEQRIVANIVRRAQGPFSPDNPDFLDNILTVLSQRLGKMDREADQYKDNAEDGKSVLQNLTRLEAMADALAKDVKSLQDGVAQMRAKG